MTSASSLARRRLAPWRVAMLAVAIGLALAAHLGALPGIVPWQIETSLHDALLRQLADERPETRLVVVDIDEHSLKSVGAWPWPRGRLADLVELLIAQQGVQSVGLDMVLPEPGAAGADARLAALAAARRLVLAQAFDFQARVPAISVGQAAGALASPPALPAMIATGIIGNHAGLAASSRVGNIGFVPDADGQIRRLPLLVKYADAIYPALALALALNRSPPDAAALARLLGRQHLDADGGWRIPYGRRMSAYLSVSAADVLAGSLPAGMLTGRQALVGSSALGLGDRVATPLDTTAAGVMVHAQSFSALLDNADRGAVGPVLAIAWFAWMLTTTAAIWLAILRGRGLWLVLTATVVALAGWYLLGRLLVAQQAALPVSPPLWAYLALLSLYLPLEWAWSQKRTREVTQLLSRYVAQPVLEELMQKHHGDLLEPTLREITVLIADMQDYTRLTAFSSLEDSAALTKNFLDQLTRPVLALGGTLDKYTGDGLVAFWGAPLPIADHASRAIAAAQAILRRIRDFNEERAKAGLPPALARIGIASGTALVGDLGTPFRSTYTAVGDCINMASRLETMAKELGVLTLVSATTRQACGEANLVSMGEVQLRGLKTPEEVFTLVEP